jgi:hypothetical protein
MDELKIFTNVAQFRRRYIFPVCRYLWATDETRLYLLRELIRKQKPRAVALKKISHSLSFDLV